MSRYTMEDASIVDTDRAAQSWEEDTYWNGSNHISVATGIQWDHEKLHRSAKGRYWVESWSNMQGVAPFARYVTPKEAAAWLLRNDGELPEDLEQFRDDILE